MTPLEILKESEKDIEIVAEQIIQNHRIPDIADSSCLYFEPDRDEIKSDIVEALNANSKSLTIKLLEGERKYWVDIFDNAPKRDKEYACDNCTKNICRIEIDRIESQLSEIKKI